MNYMTDGSIWLVNVRDPEESLHFMNLPINSQIYSYHLEDDHTVTLEEAYRRGNHFSVEVNQVGTWTRKGGLLMTKVPLWVRRQNLTGVTLRTASKHVRTFLIAFDGINM